MLKEKEWPEQPELEKTKSVSEEHRPEREETLYSAKKERDEWDTLLDRSKLWRTFRVTAWALRFKHNSLTKKHKTKKRTGPLTTEELSYARDQWIRREQAGVEPDIKSPGWKLVTEGNTGIFKCKGRIPGYQPTYIEGGVFADKLIRHIHKDIKHPGVASTMAAVREEWCKPQLRSKVRWLALDHTGQQKQLHYHHSAQSVDDHLRPQGSTSQDPSVTRFPRKSKASATS